MNAFLPHYFILCSNFTSLSFRVFDRNGDGYISKAEFKHCMMHFGEQFTDEEVEEMISEADSNQVRLALSRERLIARGLLFLLQDGRIDYTEFSQMILREISMEQKEKQEEQEQQREQQKIKLQLQQQQQQQMRQQQRQQQHRLQHLQQ